MASTVHLHKDYHTAFCGKDASHILMTYELDQSTCESCRGAAIAAQLKEKVEFGRQRQEAEKRERLHAEELARHEEALAAAEEERRADAEARKAHHARRRLLAEEAADDSGES